MIPTEQQVHRKELGAHHEINFSAIRGKEINLAGGRPVLFLRRAFRKIQNPLVLPAMRG